jgi:hypothetical protein
MYQDFKERLMLHHDQPQLTSDHSMMEKARELLSLAQAGQ